MSTGTIQDAAVQVITDLRHDALQLGFTNDSGADLKRGDEVILKTDGTVDIRDAGSERPIGIVVVGGADGDRVTVRTYFTAVMNAIATGGAIVAGVPVVPNGSKTDGVPQYIAAVATNYYCAITLNSVAQDADVVVGILDGISQLPA